MSVVANRGMYFEEILKNTCKYYSSSNKIMLFKRDLPLKIIRFLSKDTCVARIYQTAFVDYFGIYQGRHFEFEAKQTCGDKFFISNLHQHQFEHLQNVWKIKCGSFLLIYFVKYETCFLVNFPKILEFWKKQKNVVFSWFEKNAKTVDLVFPGYLNLLKNFENDCIF